jgi:hypothetical protein
MKQYHKYFGQVSQFPERYNVDSPLANDVQPVGNTQCVLYSIDDICQDKFGFDIDINELYSRVPKDKNGTVPNVVIQEVLDNGVRWEQSGLRSKPFLTSFVAHKGAYDAFDNVRSVITSEKASIMVWGQWDYLWGTSSVMAHSTHSLINHCCSIKGWDIIDSVEMLIIEAHVGHFLYCPRSVFNYWASQAYFNTAVLSEKPLITYWTQLRDYCIQLLSLLKKNNMNFDTPQEAYHSVRVMCDNAGLTVKMKNDICATIYQESGFKKNAIGKPNANGSRDWGICQHNDNPANGWIGKGCLFSSTQECLDNPERAVKSMIQCFKDGHANWWMGYAVRAKWLLPNSPMWKLKNY